MLLFALSKEGFTQFSPEEQNKINHLNQIINSSKSHDTSVAQSYIELIDILYQVNFDTISLISNKVVQLCENALNKKPSKKVSISLKNSKAQALNNIGYVYDNQGKIRQSLIYYHRSLKILEETGNMEGMATSLNNIGYIYESQERHEKALEYYLKSLKIEEEINNMEGVSGSLSNLGILYEELEEYEKAFQSHSQALKISEELDDKIGVARGLNNIGSYFEFQGEIDKAMNYYNKSLAIEEEINNVEGIITSQINIGRLYLHQKKMTLAKKYLSSSLKQSKLLGFPILIKNSTKLLYIIAEKQGNYKETFEMYQLYITMRDSINNEETYRATIQQSSKYEYEKQTAADSIVNAEAEKVHLANLAAETAKSEKNELEVKAQKKQKWFLYIGLGLVALFAIFMFNRFRVTQKQKNVIDEQKQLVEKQKSSVEQQKEQIELQHHQLEETHQEISDSIKYAERLQLAILPSKEDLKEGLKDSFVLFQPKDVVSGDFYWLQKVKNTVYFAAADCTGHGVPGAMVSVVCSNALNRSVKEFGLTQPNEILNKTRELVIETFARSGTNIKDGMDIALCAKNEHELHYSGANNPLWIVRKTVHLTETQKEEKSTMLGKEVSLIEYKANKQPIGLYEGMKDFEQVAVPTFEGDTLYIFTDGFADQFGGAKGKKFKYKPFKQLLLDINQQKMKTQEETIDNAFNSWKGGIEQLDDVCIIGVRV